MWHGHLWLGFYKYIFYKIQLVDKGINFSEKETLQHYVTFLHPLFSAQNNIPYQHNRIPNT